MNGVLAIWVCIQLLHGKPLARLRHWQAFVDLLGRLWSRLPCVCVTMQPPSDEVDEDDECEFDVRFTDIY